MGMLTHNKIGTARDSLENRESKQSSFNKRTLSSTVYYFRKPAKFKLTPSDINASNTRNLTELFSCTINLTLML